MAADALFARDPYDILDNSDCLASCFRDRRILVRSSHVHVFLAVGATYRGHIHGCLVLKGSFELSWRREKYPVLMLHR